MIVVVHWIDAWANSAGYYDSTYKYAPLIMEDIGYLIEENKHGILTARCQQERDDEGPRYRGESFTPWEMVTKVEEIVL